MPPTSSLVFGFGILYLLFIGIVDSEDAATTTVPTVPTTPGLFANLPTLPPFDLASLTNFTIPTLPTIDLSNLKLPTFPSLESLHNNPTVSPTMPNSASHGPPGNFTPPLGNFTMPTFATNHPMGNFTFGTMPPLGNFTFGTLPPLGNFTFGTIPPLGNFTFPTFGTMPPLGNFTFPTFGTMPPLGNFTFGTLPPLGNFTFPTFGTMPPLGNFTMPTFGTMPPLGNFTFPTFGTMPPLGNFTMPTFGTMPPLGNFTFPTFGTMPPLGNFTFGTIPPLGNFTMHNSTPLGAVTIPPLGNFTLGTTTTPAHGNLTGTIPPLGNFTLLPSILNMTFAPGVTTPCGTATCTPTQACATEWNNTQVCVNRLSEKTYCVDGPCPNGMKCFDNVTSHAYTCYMKLDGSTGECLGVKCSPGDICYQIEKQPAKCISLVQAPKCLGRYEEFSACKSGCESTCLEPNPSCMNSTTCTSGCACIRGYVRHNTQCELMSVCQSSTTGNVTCSGTEEYTSCKPLCEKTCNGIPTERCMTSMTSTTTPSPSSCKVGCVCRAGYKRDSATGLCVHARQCYAATKCGANETWSKCRNCEPVCGQTKNPSCKSCWSGCACIQGYSRNQWGSCVMTEQCII